MLGLNRILAFGLLVTTFVFLPNENWDYWFVGDKGDYYAEFCLRDKQSCYVLAKNLLSTEVELGFASIRRGWVQKIGSEEIIEMDSSKAVPPGSYSLIEIDPSSFSAEVRHSLERKQTLRPKNLVLVTPFEEQKWFLLVFVLILTSAGLTYSIVSYVGEESRQKSGIAEDCS